MILAIGDNYCGTSTDCYWTSTENKLSKALAKELTTKRSALFPLKMHQVPH